MADYVTYAASCQIKQQDMVETIKKEYPKFGKEQMSLACNPWRNALQLVPDAEKLLVKEYGMGPGLSITPSDLKKRSHEPKDKPNKLCVRLTNDTRSRLQEVYEQMCFASYQDMLEAAVIEFCEKYRARR